MTQREAARDTRQLLETAGGDVFELVILARRLVAERFFGYAREVLQRAREVAPEDTPEELRRWMAEQQAYCTFKDPDLPLGPRLDRAHELLETATDLAATSAAPALLGLAGDVWMRKWEADAQTRHLERALAYYRRGCAEDKRGSGAEWGYNGVKAALVLDLIASLEATEAMDAGTTSDVAGIRRGEAERIRLEVVLQLPARVGAAGDVPDSEFWPLITIAEAQFGLGHYDEASALLARARAGREDRPWELESTARHLAALLRVAPEATAGEPDQRGLDVLRAFLGEKMAAGARTAYRGKVGLALSGGGFRASLFHIGVLARLAELDVLREVEVLSCVSGGSIVGAHWYLQVRELLRAPRPEFLDADGAIKREAYIKLVEETADAFVRGVKSNMRLRAIGATGHNVRSIFDPAVTRTTRLGQLYESELYAQVRDGTAPEDERYISKLYIEPGDETGERPFSPRADNWHRRDKVPILVLNATTLNSGHNWQFTASWMGEPASGMDEDVDPAPRLRRVPYDSANRQVRLGDAVAASACVPGLFEPLMLADLYRDDSADRGERDWTVGLVDGGVHDNEGTDSLLTEDCGVIVVSDASGQKKPKKTAGQAILGVLLRTTGILKARVREAEWRELEARREAGSLQGLAYVHLRKDLDSPAVPWVGASRWEPLDDAPPPSTPPGAAPPREGMTYYGVRKDVQDLLAEIRTDLDSFTEMEAYALMTSGYLMTKERFGRGVADLRRSAPSEAWRFLAVRDQMCDPDLEPRELKAVLRAGKSLWLKPWILSAPLRRASVPLALVLVPLLLVLSIVALGMAAGVGVALGVANLASAIGRWRRHARAPERKTSVPDAVQRVVLGSLLATAGSVVAWAYMRLFDPHYLDAGRVGARRG